MNILSEEIVKIYQTLSERIDGKNVIDIIYNYETYNKEEREYIISTVPKHKIRFELDLLDKDGNMTLLYFNTKSDVIGIVEKLHITH